MSFEKKPFLFSEPEAKQVLLEKIATKEVSAPSYEGLKLFI